MLSTGTQTAQLRTYTWYHTRTNNAGRYVRRCTKPFFCKQTETEQHRDREDSKNIKKQTRNGPMKSGNEQKNIKTGKSLFLQQYRMDLYRIKNAIYCVDDSLRVHSRNTPVRAKPAQQLFQLSRYCCNLLTSFSHQHCYCAQEVVYP